jgi:hypothetical protein
MVLWQVESKPFTGHTRSYGNKKSKGPRDSHSRKAIPTFDFLFEERLLLGWEADQCTSSRIEFDEEGRPEAMPRGASFTGALTRSGDLETVVG